MEEHEIKIEEEVIVVEVSAIGERGPQGEQGPTGATPNISVNSTTTLPAGSSATVELDASSTAENPKFNFGIPKGDTGEVTQAEFDALEDEVNDLYNNQIEGTATGTNINITDSANVRTKSLSLDGRCTQGANPSPDNPQEIEVISGTVQAKVCGKNQLKLQDLYTQFSTVFNCTYTNGVLEIQRIAATTANYSLNLKENTQYTFSFDYKNVNSDYYISIRYSDGTGTTITSERAYSDYTRITATSTAGKSVVGIRFEVFGSSNHMYIKNFQLEEGTTATTYEEYKEQILNVNLNGNELYSLPNNVKDELVIQNGIAKIIKKTGKVVLVGTETFSTDMTGSNIGQGVYGAKVNIPNMKTFNNFAYGDLNINALCSNLFKTSKLWARTVVGIDCGWGNDLYFKIFTSTIDNPTTASEGLTKFKQWLSTHNTTVYYQLATPTEINLGAVTQPKTYKTTSNISNNKDTNMSLTYYKDLEKLISDIQTAIVSLS